jgi:hypothetical protein
MQHWKCVIRERAIGVEETRRGEEDRSLTPEPFVAKWPIYDLLFGSCF